jgi:hypothetical protein
MMDESVNLGPCPWCGAPQHFAGGAPLEEARFLCHECNRHLRYVPGVGILDRGATATSGELLGMAEALEHLAKIRAQRKTGDKET